MCSLPALSFLLISCPTAKCNGFSVSYTHLDVYKRQARAIAKNPEIYIFDDSFSALDYKTDAALRKALKQTIEHSTIFIIAQRISTVVEADRIVVLDEGEIAGIGTHSERLQTSEVYRQIALSQLSKEELGL